MKTLIVNGGVALLSFLGLVVTAPAESPDKGDFRSEVTAVTAQLKKKFDAGEVAQTNLAENINAIHDLILKHQKGPDREQLSRLYMLDAHIRADGLKDTVKASEIWTYVAWAFPGTPAAQGAKICQARLFAVAGPELPEGEPPQIGWRAPNFTAKDIDGKTIKLSDYRGKIVVLESYNGHGCMFCDVHYVSGAMQELQREFTTNGVIWLLIDFAAPAQHQTPASARQEWTDQNMAVTDWIIDTDSDYQIGRRYAMKSTPEAFVIDKNGKLVYQGAIDNFGKTFEAEMQATYVSPTAKIPTATVLDNRKRVVLSLDPRKARNYVREAVQALLSGKEVAVPETKPYGCPLGHRFQ